MTKTAVGRRTAHPHPPSSGIFGPEWFKWRGATLTVRLGDEPPFMARLDAVAPSGDPDRKSGDRDATLTLLDASGRPSEVRNVPWPPAGSVRVIRMP